MSDLLDLLSVMAQIANFIGELATLPSFPNSIWERNCLRNSVASARNSAKTATVIDRRYIKKIW